MRDLFFPLLTAFGPRHFLNRDRVVSAAAGGLCSVTVFFFFLYFLEEKRVLRINLCVLCPGNYVVNDNDQERPEEARGAEAPPSMIADYIVL